ncbi:fibronectin type III domain-containing protein [Modestobacter sp. URMC 112]
MDHQDVPAVRRRRGWGARTLLSLLLLAGVLVGAVPPADSPALRPASTTDPVPPTNVAATGADRALAVSWTASAEAFITGYRVFVDGTLAASPTGTSAMLGGLVNGHTYNVTVRTVTSFLGTTYVGTTASTPVLGIPRDAVAAAPPTGVTAVRGDGQVTVSWAANTADYDADGYRVLRDGVPVTGLLAGRALTSHVDPGLQNDRSYSYTVQTHDTSGNWSASSAPPVVVTPTDLTPPAAPAPPTATRGDGEVSLTWPANAEPDVASYRVRRNGVHVADGPATTYVDRGLVNDTPYSYTLVAVDRHGNVSPASAPVTATPTDLTPPAAPAPPTATRGDGEVSLTWPANAEPDVASYRVRRNGVQVADGPATTYVDRGLVNDTPYSYTLVAVDRHGNASPASAPAVTATPTDLTPPAAPTGLTATAGDTLNTLAWTANPEPDVASYRVLRDGVQVGEVPGTDHVDRGLVNGTSYAYTLVAVDRHGNASPASAPPARATPVDVTAPTAPTGVRATAGDRQAVVHWAAAPEPDVVAHRVLAEDGTVVATAAAPATSAPVTGLTNGTTYRFTVVAVDGAGWVSPASAAVSVVPAPSAVPVDGAGQSGGLAVSRDGRYLVVGTRAQREPADTNTAYELYLLDETADTARRIAPLPASATGATDPTNTGAPAVSDDGRFVALATTAALVPADRNGMADVYRLDTGTGVWSLVSVPAATGTVSSTAAGTLLQTGSSVYATSPPVALSADGDLVFFYSARPDLVTGDTNGAVDVFAKRMSDGMVTRVSATATGGNLPRTATGPALAVTPDGRFALFPATSSTGPVVLYRKTLSGAGAGTVTVVSSVVVSGRTTEYGVFRDTGDIAISDDGRYLALVTAAKLGTATPGSSWPTGLAYRVDTATGDVLPMGTGQTTVWEHQVALDPTGRYGFFATAAAVVPGDGNGHTDHHRRDLDGGTVGPVVLATADAAGLATTGPTGSVTTSEYGRLVALTADRVVVTTSQALVPTDTNRVRDLYTKDLLTGAVGSPVG